MIKEVQIIVPAAHFQNEKKLLQSIAQQAGISANQKIEFDILKKSLDARSKEIRYNLQLRLFVNEEKTTSDIAPFKAQNVKNKKEIHIIGAGPAGLFCALQCIESGLKPVLFERGKDVRERRRDLAALNKEGLLNEESNYCFGEGGAGTYSDGKLYTRSNKRGKLKTVLEWLCEFGAEKNILYEAHPHIGTNKLPQIISSIRKKIIECGGEIHFNEKLTDVETQQDKITAIILNGHTKVKVSHLVLATGHSASDIYFLLHRKKIKIEAKPFALGVRVEHPQYIIDQAQYRCTTRPDYLPPSSYSVVEQVNQRGVFSFCMCPGGIIAPASTQHEHLVINGWSPSKRNNPYANSGIVVAINENDYQSTDALSGLEFQHETEQKAFKSGGGKYVAPAMRMTDFVNKKLSSTLPSCSYLPGLKSALLHEVLPDFVYKNLQQAFLQFDKKIKGYYTHEACVVGVESRTSSPVRISRHSENFQHHELNNLYPCAEGAGYAGGIVSAAMDGMNIAESIKRRLVG